MTSQTMASQTDDSANKTSYDDLAEYGVTVTDDNVADACVTERR